jgi:carboxypeptidase family protein
MTTLSGRITVQGGMPATDAVVELHNATGDVMDQVRVNDDGRYRFYVGPGIWSLTIWDPYGHRGVGEANVLEGDDETLDIDLKEPRGQRQPRKSPPRHTASEV